MSVGGVVLHMPCSFHSEIRELVPTLVIPCHLWTVVLYSPSRPLFGPLECKRFNCLFCPKIVDTRVNISTVHQNGLQFIFELLVNWKDCWSAVCVVHHLRAKTPLSSIIICEYSFLNISSVEVIAQGGVVNALKANSQKRKKKKLKKQEKEISYRNKGLTSHGTCTCKLRNCTGSVFRWFTDAFCVHVVGIDECKLR